jgi:hypothetical protein
VFDRYKIKEQTNSITTNGTMSEADCQCEAAACRLFIYDQCDDCRGSFCESCINNHICGELNIQIAGNKRDSDMELDELPATSSSSSASSSQMSSISDVPMPPPLPKKKIKAGNVVIPRVDVRNYYAPNDGFRPDYKEINLIPSKSSSWVWSHFKKFNPAMHPLMKNMASCNLCYTEAAGNNNVKFFVEYKVITIP